MSGIYDFRAAGVDELCEVVRQRLDDSACAEV